MASSHCAVCNIPAPNKCSRCKTYVYCGTECQKLNWPKHKAICKDAQLKQVLERTATIVHEAFLKFRENTWDTPIDKVEDNFDALVTYDGLAPQGSAYFIDFPNDLMPNDRAKMAVLTMLMCNEPLAWMHDMFMALTKGLDIRVEELEVALRWVPRKTTAVHLGGYRQDNWPEYFHSLVRVTSTKTGTSWVVDIGGGQYGICTPFWSWTEYRNLFVSTDQAVKIYPQGTHRDVLHILGKIQGNPTMIYGLVGDVAGAINEAVTTFEKRKTLQLAALVHLGDQQEFERHKKDLLDAIDAAVRNYKLKNKSVIATKWRASQSYEFHHPSESQQKNSSATRTLYAARLVKTEYFTRTSVPQHFNEGGLHHIVL